MISAVSVSSVSGTVMLLLGASLLLVAWRTRVRRNLDSPSGKLHASINHSDTLRKDDRLGEARDVLLEVTEHHHRDASLHYRLACLHSLLGDFREARVSLKNACALDENWIAPAMHDPDLKGLRQIDSVGSQTPAPSAD